MMNTSDYFEIVSAADQVIHLRQMGDWSTVVMTELAEPFLTQFCAAVDSMAGQPFFALVDTTKLAQPSDEAMAVIGQVVKYAREHNLVRVMEVLPGDIDQTEQQSDNKDFVTIVDSIAEGREKINKLKSS